MLNFSASAAGAIASNCSLTTESAEDTEIRFLCRRGEPWLARKYAAKNNARFFDYVLAFAEGAEGFSAQRHKDTKGTKFFLLDKLGIASDCIGVSLRRTSLASIFLGRQWCQPTLPSKFVGATLCVARKYAAKNDAQFFNCLLAFAEGAEGIFSTKAQRHKGHKVLALG